MSENSWKSKYEALKMKYIQDMDMAFRLGYEQGAQEAQNDAMMQQQQQQADQMAVQTGMQGDPSGQPGEEQQEPQIPDSTNPQGSELDQHISTLEGMLGKGEINAADLMKSVADFRKLQKSMQMQEDLKKSAKAIPEIAKALHKPAFKVGVQANHNMTSAAKKAVGMQEQVVSDIMKAWDEEAKKTGGDILKQLKVEGIIKE